MPNRPNVNDIVWDESNISWDKPQGEQSLPLKDVPGQALSNVPKGLLDYAKMLISPSTYKGMLESTKTLSPYERTESGYFRKYPVPEEQMGALGERYAQDYGGYENIKRTVAERPVDVFMDMATALTGFGGALSATGKATKAASTISRAGRAIEPVNILKETVALPLKLVPEKVATRWYQSALKMSSKVPSERRAALTKAGLEHGIIPNDKGLEKLGGIIDSVDDQINQLVDPANTGLITINKERVISKLEELKGFYENSAYGSPHLKTIERIEKDFRKMKPEEIFMGRAQEIKRNTYVTLRKSYGEFKGASVEAQKSLARGILDEMVDVYPELRSLGQKEKTFIDLQNTIEQSVKRIYNTDIFGIGTPIWGTAGATISSPTTGGILMLTRAVIDNPIVKSKLAIYLSKAQRGPKISAPSTAGRLGVYQGSKISMEE